MEIDRGSLWNRWDFHIHTPYSLLHNEYGFDPNEDFEGNDPFDIYVKTLFSKAIESNVKAIGITDYFSIEGYKRIRNDYLNNPEKMRELFPDAGFREKISNIFVFPNIEFRLNTFVGKNSHSVNYHVFFSDSIAPNDIEECFIQRLNLIHSHNGTLPLTKHSIERIGREYKNSNPETKGTNYIVGLEHISINYKEIMDVLADSTILTDKYIISIPVDEDLSQIDWKGRDYYTRKVLYQQCHMLMTSNLKTKDWALAKGHEDEQINEFGSIMPCIWGSDAHSYDQMFQPAEGRFCWIKAMPSFEGLQQVLYEPSDRVRIQKERPEVKDEHQIIDYIIFDNENFQRAPIYLSEGLTAIIGGKSTGKSILLRHIARGIDRGQVKEKEEKTARGTSEFNVDSKVIWRDGASGERKIIYIPQSWLNRVVDESSGDSQLNTMLRDILLQQEDISRANTKLKERLDEINESLKHVILNYTVARDRVEECERNLHDFGRSDAFQSAIKKLEKQREELTVEAGVTDDLLRKYTELEKSFAEHNEKMDMINKEELNLVFQSPPFVYIPHMTNLSSVVTPQYELNEIPTVREIINEVIIKMNDVIKETWEEAILEAKQKIAEKKDSEQEIISNIQKELIPLQQLVSKNEQLRKIEAQLHEEKEKYKKAKSIEDIQAENISNAEELKKKILSSRNLMREAYEDFVSQISISNIPNSELEFEAEIRDERQKLFDTIGGLFDNRNLRPFREKFKYNISNVDEFIIEDGLFEALWIAMTEGILSFKAGNTVQSALERLFSDWYYIHYTVKSEQDKINNMSPGKKALVLLEMIVNLEKSRCPILIDQPEDDLDNRSIYTDLVSYIKAKKHERQIIVVTHNANVVVGADAEEVIIANQHGKESPNREKRFEYRSGAIENTVPVFDDNGNILGGVLNQKGIQEQICDILEGGKDAFELRRKKYIR